MIPQSFIDDLLDRTDLPQLVGERVALARKGAGHEGLCPFHEEKTPSFKVFDDHYHCFGCGAHGTAIDFSMVQGGLSFRDAVVALAARAGLKVVEDPGKADVRRPADNGVLATLRAACCEYQKLLFHPADNPGQRELAARGIDTETAVNFGIGYAPDAWGTLSDTTGKFRGSDLVAAGLAVGKPSGKGYYDRFRGRLMFPISDPRGEVVGFGGRLLLGDGPKYLNSPETTVYKKGTLLFGLHQALPTIRQAGSVIVGEGYFDVVTPAQHGIHNIVSTSGTALTEEQVELLLSIADQIVFCFDGDAAGNKATWAAAELIVPHLSDANEVRFCRLPDGHDPDSYVRERGADAFRELAAGAPTLAEYLTAEIRRGALNPEAKSRAMRAAAVMWRRFNAPALALFFRQAVSAALGMSDREFGLLAGARAAGNNPMLRPCPFCGGGAALGDNGSQAQVYCTCCGCATPAVDGRDAAQLLWNRRERARRVA
jgi:DNA primase